MARLETATMFYSRLLRMLCEEGAITNGDSVFVACGGDTDARALAAVGIGGAVISNLDERRNDGIGSYDWLSADAENLPAADDSYDWGIVHAGLHHCASPHRGLLELLRIARKGVLVIEARDSAVTRLAVRLGFTPDYELDSVALGAGGVRNTPVPNFIYRWTEREVWKTVESARPEIANHIRFFYALSLPEERLSMHARPRQVAYRVAAAAVRLVVRVMPRQGNLFGFVVTPGPDKPWIARDPGPILDPEFKLPFDPRGYVREEVGPSPGDDRAMPVTRREPA